MRKATLLILLVALASPLFAGRSSVEKTKVEARRLSTNQDPWEIAESENSGDTQATALAVTERTKTLVDAAIAAASSGDDNISIFIMPSHWNAVRFRDIGITDAATTTHQIYLGSLVAGGDCELSHAGQLAWTVGTQTSIYDQITFTSGGTYEPRPGDTVTGVTSTKTAVVVSTVLSGGAWADGDAAGTITYRSASGAFTSGEKVSINSRGTVKADVLTHAASDLIDFELADTVLVTPGAWGGAWTATSPANNTNAEAELDVKGANYMIVVTTATTVDSKLLVTGY
ncbi:hypothetical protein LCGC14_0826930 [marine sediment metagenome]|uniref:Uncharacterized protein n=1 Tax=marine sediment metagenome TaxID=412755 RepID=A0A0F9SPH6_9ZZZZ